MRGYTLAWSAIFALVVALHARPNHTVAGFAARPDHKASEGKARQRAGGSAHSPPSPPEQGGASWEAVVMVAFAAAGFVQGVAGFGAGIVAMSICPMALPVMEASPIVAVFALCVCGALAVQLRNALGSPAVRPVLQSLLLGCACGVPLGGFLLTWADPRWLRLVLGACMLVFAAERVMHHDGDAAAKRVEQYELASVAAGDGVELQPVKLSPAATAAVDADGDADTSPRLGPSAGTPHTLERRPLD